MCWRLNKLILTHEEHIHQLVHTPRTKHPSFGSILITPEITVSLGKAIPGTDELIEHLHIGHWSQFKLKFLAQFLLKLVEQPPREDMLIDGYLHLPSPALISKQQCCYC